MKLNKWEGAVVWTFWWTGIRKGQNLKNHPKYSVYFHHRYHFMEIKFRIQDNSFVRPWYFRDDFEIPNIIQLSRLWIWRRERRILKRKLRNLHGSLLQKQSVLFIIFSEKRNLLIVMRLQIHNSNIKEGSKFP